MKAFRHFLGRLMALSSSQRALASQVNDVGVNLAEMGLLNEAVINFTTATALNPGSATYWLNLGNTYRGLGKYEKACKCFESGGGLKDTSAAFYNCWGLALFSLPRFTDAIKMYKKSDLPGSKLCTRFNASRQRIPTNRMAGRCSGAIRGRSSLDAARPTCSALTIVQFEFNAVIDG